MKKKPAAKRIAAPKPVPTLHIGDWHNGAEIEIYSYARSLRKAAATLLLKRQEDPTGRTDWDVCPILLLYRQTLELHLKVLVGDGSPFLKNRNSFSLSQTRSLPWLAQLVCQVIKAVKWENEFTCSGIGNLADFSALVNEVESLDAAVKAIHTVRFDPPNSLAIFYRTFNIVEFAKKLDALLDLLDVTADLLSAAWDLEQDERPFPPEVGQKPTIH